MKERETEEWIVRSEEEEEETERDDEEFNKRATHQICDSQHQRRMK